MNEVAIKTMTVQPGDVIVLELDYGALPPAAATRYVEQAKAEIGGNFPNNKVLVLPMHRSRLSVVHFTDAPEAIIEDVEYKEVKEDASS